MLLYPSLSNAVQKALAADLNTGVTSSLTLNNTTSIEDKPGVCVIDRIDNTGQLKNPSFREFIRYTGVSGNTLTGLTRNVDNSSSDQEHAIGAIVEFIPDVTWAKAVMDALEEIVDPDTGLLDDTKIVTPTGTQTLTNKTLTSPVLNGDLTGDAILDEDDMASDSATKVPSQQSVKAYVDAEIAGINTSSVNFATSGAQGTVAINSDTPTDVSGVSVAINPTATATVHATVSGDIYSSDTSVDFELDLVIDGVTIQSVPLRTPGSNLRTSFSLNGQATVSSGARTIKLQARSSPSAKAFTVDDANLSVIWS